VFSHFGLVTACIGGKPGF